MSELAVLKKVHIKLAMNDGLDIFCESYYGFMVDIKVDKETAANSKLSEDGVYFWKYFLPFESIDMSKPSAPSRLLGKDLPVDALHLLYEIVSVAFIRQRTSKETDFEALRVKYEECLGGMDIHQIYNKLPECRVRKWGS